MVVSLGAGSVAGLFSATICFPLDLVRRRLQMPARGSPGRPLTALHAALAAGVLQAWLT